MVAPAVIQYGARFERTRTYDRFGDGGQTGAASPSSTHCVADAMERVYANQTAQEHAVHPGLVGKGAIPRHVEGTSFPRRKLAGWALLVSVMSPCALRYHLPVAERLTKVGERELDNHPVGRGRRHSF